MPLDSAARTKLRQQWKEQGWISLPNFYNHERTEKLRLISEYCLAQWRICNPENGKPGDAGDGKSISMRHLNHPGYYTQHPEWFAPLMEAVAAPECLDVVEAVIGEPPLFRCTSLFMNPLVDNLEGNWHRDSQFMLKTEAEERQLIAEGAPDTGMQLQVALVPSDDIEYIPGSHLRWDTEEEYNIRRANGQKNNRQPIPGAMRLSQKPGDMLAFNPYGLHRGRYHSDKFRRTFMVTYTGTNGARKDYFSKQPWFLTPGHLAALNQPTQAFFARFVDTMQDFWKQEVTATTM